MTQLLHVFLTKDELMKLFEKNRRDSPASHNTHTWANSPCQDCLASQPPR
ncbi:hypothetical protein NXF25_019873 [Crotalus adamanteus]|uniref:Uncharacterized protein n=1 Tax=Crotalus adamanteus TaxID=8729 RepID=A0AAW1B359_CROAD